jgi:glucokinase
MGAGAGILVGVDIGGTKTAVVVGEAPPEGLRILDRMAFLTEPRTRGWADVVQEIIETTRLLVARHDGGRSRSPACIGVSCGGPLDSRAGLIQSPPNLPGWDDVPLTRELSRGLGCDAYLQNDANACALAEWRFGAGRGARTMVFLTFGTGMGAGLIIDGRLFEGTNDLAGEVGHWRLAEEGPHGYGKNGSFEAFCSGSGIAKLARAAAEKRFAEGGVVAFCPDRASLPAVTARGVAEAAEAGDSLARDIYATSGRYLGRGLSLIIDVINPERIVIGSIFARCGALLRSSMEAEIAREALPAAARVCRIVPAELGESIGDYACLSVAVDALGRVGGTS